MSAQPLRVAEPLEVRRAAGRLIRADRPAFVWVLLTNCAAAGAGLLGPWLLGLIVNDVQAGAGVATVNRLGLLVLLAAAAQFLIGRQARYLGSRFGERTAAHLREQLTDRLMRLPARTVERAGTGDLTSRATTDAALVAFVLRDAAPEMVFALVQALIIVAVVLLSPLLGAVGLVALVGVPVVLRWYLRRARPAYLAHGAANAEVAEVLASTSAGARTVETLGLQERRATACSTAIAAVTAAQLRTPPAPERVLPDGRHLHRTGRRGGVRVRRDALPQPAGQSRHRRRGHPLPPPAQHPDHPGLGRDAAEQCCLSGSTRGPRRARTDRTSPDRRRGDPCGPPRRGHRRPLRLPGR